jgi:hypothetical protein
MKIHLLPEIVQSVDRHKLYVLKCSTDKLADCVSWLQDQKINTIDIGRELAAFIEGLEDYSYLSIDVFDYIIKLLDRYKSKVDSKGNDVVAVHNLGILLEPTLRLNAAQLLKDFSKTAGLIIIWDNLLESSGRLCWTTQQGTVFFDLTEIKIKNLQYAV